MYKALIIGCGRIGAEYDFAPVQKQIMTHAGAYRANPAIRLVAVCDLDIEKAKKAQKKWKIPAIYQDYKIMIATEKPDIISVCTWEDTHAQIIKNIIKHAPKAILCEKPIAASIEEAKEIIDVCKKSRTILQVNYMRRFSPLYQEIAIFIAEGRLGKIQKITGHYGNGIMTNASHLIDLIHFFLKEKLHLLYAKKSPVISAYPNDPNHIILGESSSGIPFSLLPQDNSKYLLLEMKIYGEEGMIHFKKNGFEVDYYISAPHSIFPGQKELILSELPFKNKSDGRFIENSIHELITSVQNGTKPLCTGEDALKTLEFILKCK